MNDKFDPTKPVMTRDGSLKGKIVWTGKDKVIAVLGDIEEVEVRCGNGYYYKGGPRDNRDLINIPEEMEADFWVNMYPGNIVGDLAYRTKEQAKCGAGDDRTACLHIERTYKPGEGLENK